MKKYKAFLLVFLPVFITLIYLCCKEADVFNKSVAHSTIYPRITRAEDYLPEENQKSPPRVGLIKDSPIKMFRTRMQIYDSSVAVFYEFSLQDFHQNIDSVMFNDKITISIDIFTKQKTLNCDFRFVVCQESSGKLKY